MSGYPGAASESQSEGCRRKALQLLDASRTQSAEQAPFTVAQAQVYATLAISLELSWIAPA